MADWRLPQFQQLQSAAQAGDQGAATKLNQLQQQDTNLYNSLVQQSTPSSAPTTTTAPPEQPPQMVTGPGETIQGGGPPTTTTTTPPPTTTTQPPAQQPQGDNRLPSWLGAAGSAGGQFAADIRLPSWLQAPSVSGSRVLATLAGSEPRAPHSSFARGMETRLPETWQLAKERWGVGGPETPPPGQEESYLNPYSRVLRKGMAATEMGFDTANEVLRQFVETTFAKNADGSPNFNAPQYGDIAGRTLTGAAIAAGLDSLARIAYNNWPSTLRRSIIDYDEAQQAKRAADAAVDARNAASRQQYAQDVATARQTRAQARQTRRLGIRAADTAHQQSAEAAATAAQNTLDQASGRLANALAQTQPDARTSMRLRTLQAAPEGVGPGGVGPPNVRQLSDRSWIERGAVGSRTNPGSMGPMTQAEVDPALMRRRGIAQGMGAAYQDAQTYFEAAQRGGSPQQIQENLRRGYQALEAQFPGIQRDPTWQHLVQAAEDAFNAREPLPPAPVLQRPPRERYQPMAPEGRGRRPERPTYGQARNRVISSVAGGTAGNLARLGVVGAAAGGTGALVAKLMSAYADAYKQGNSGAIPP